MKMDPEIKNKTVSPIAKAVKSFKKRNAPFIRIEKSDPDTENNSPKQKNTEAYSGDRGIVYVGHLPEGFYENEMREYFSQFGQVTRLKLARSSKTGVSRGYAFIEFRFSEVAKIVAETMNNYLLFDRLLKVNYVDKTFPASFWYKAPTSETYPGVRNRRRHVGLKNSFKQPAKEMKRSKLSKKRLNATLRKLKENGINYDIQADDLVSVDKKMDLNNAAPVLEVDESDDEIEFKVPSYFIRKSISKKDSPRNKQLRQRKKKNKRPPLSSPVGANGNTQITLAKNLKQKQGLPAQKSVGIKSPIKVESALIAKSEPTHVNQRNCNSPMRKNAKPFQGTKSPARLSPIAERCNTPISLDETRKPNQGTSARKSFKRKSLLKVESDLNVKSETEDIIQQNGKSPLRKKSESTRDALQDAKRPPMSSPVGGKPNTGISVGQTPKQKQNFSARKSVKGKSPLTAEPAVNVKSELKQIDPRNGSPLRKVAESTKDTKNIVQKAKQHPETKTPKKFSLLSKNSNNDKSQFSNDRKPGGKASNKKLQKNKSS